MGWVTCCQCKEQFAMTDATEAALRKSTQTFHCPFGHRQHFTLGPSEADKLRQERDRLKQDAARLEESVTFWREAEAKASRRASAMKGQVTKLKTRAAAGVCPCCNRTFVNLQRHMSSKHAGFLAEEVQEREGRTLQ